MSQCGPEVFDHLRGISHHRTASCVRMPSFTARGALNTRLGAPSNVNSRAIQVGTKFLAQHPPRPESTRDIQVHLFRPETFRSCHYHTIPFIEETLETRSTRKSSADAQRTLRGRGRRALGPAPWRPSRSSIIRRCSSCRCDRRRDVEVEHVG